MTRLGTTEGYGFFRVTGEALTAESCEAGDVAERGYVDRFGQFRDEPWEGEWDLQEIVEQFGRGYRPEGDGSGVPRWLSFEASCDDLVSPCDGWSFLGEEIDGEEVIGGGLSVHRPDWITDGSWLRVCRLLGWRPYRG